MLSAGKSLSSQILRHAQMAELADALDSKSGSFGSVGSRPTLGTMLRSTSYAWQAMHREFMLLGLYTMAKSSEAWPCVASLEA